jgi:N-acetyl-anhydromuramyl-L-alanine amidase AmpD
MNVIEFPTKRQLPARNLPIRAVIVHTTGDTDLQKILNFYQSPDGYQPHYMIESDGDIRRIVAEDHVAWHAAIQANEAAAYQRGFAHWSAMRWSSDQNDVEPFGGFFPGFATWKATRHQLPKDRRHLLGHYDVSPLRRSTSHGGWDPGEKFNWSRFLGLVNAGNINVA